MDKSMDTGDIDAKYGNREEILADFQGCTGIDDLGEAIEWLEAADWNLLVAIQKAVPQHTQSQADVLMCIGESSSSESVRNGGVLSSPVVSVSSDFASVPSTSNQRTLQLKIHSGDRAPLAYQAHESMSLMELRTLLYADTSLPICAQHLTGWEVEPSSDDPPLSRLVKSDNVATLFLSCADRQEASTFYHLKIKDKDNGREYQLRLPGSESVTGVMDKTRWLTSIPVAFQDWDGWPPGKTNESTLAALPLDRPVHTLCVRTLTAPAEVVPKPSAVTLRRSMFVDLADSDSSPEDFEDAPETFTDEMFVDESAGRRSEPLIPDNVEDETAASVHFNDGFSRRYGSNVPNFLFGCLEEAMKEAFSRPARERRMLGIYLHHDKSVLSNVFCTELLGAPEVLDTFNNFFVLWGWDLTNEANRNMLLALVMSNLGAEAASAIRRMAIDQLPALMIFARTSYNSENLSTIFGNVGLSEFTGYLMHAVELYTSIQEAEIREEDERTARDQIKTEQDQAFQQSLQADRAKEEAKRRQRELDSQEEQRKRETEEAEELRRETERQTVLSSLPPEPEDAAPAVITLRFRNPSGGAFVRKFLPDDPISRIFDYLLTEGFRVAEYKIITSWPRTDISTRDPSTTLRQINLPPQETLILEER